MERDLLVQTGFTLDDVGGALPWSALGAFLHRIEPDGAIAQEIEPDIAAFSSRFKTNAILADIYDVLAQINANLVAGFSRKRSLTLGANGQAELNCTRFNVNGDLSAYDYTGWSGYIPTQNGEIHVENGLIVDYLPDT